MSILDLNQYWERMNDFPFVLLKLSKFIIVGIFGFIIDFGITYFLKEKIFLNKYISNSTGFIIAASFNYIFNRLWTFSSDNPNLFLEYSTFIIVSILGLFINNVILYLFHNKLLYNFYVSKICATVITTIWNIFANYYITFSI